MPLRIVQSKQNARLKELRRALRRPGRDTRGLAGIEGPHLLEEALRAGLRVAAVFATAQTVDLLRAMGVPEDTEILVLDRELLAPELDTETPQPLAALVEMPDWTWAHVLRSPGASDPLVIVLAGLQDPGNLGTILRSAEAFKATGIVCLPGTVSPWNPKAVRASAGSIFRVPMIAASREECFAELREAGVRVVATDVRSAAPAEEVNLTGPVALVIGNEGNGVPAEVMERADARITIPCPGPVESLNAAVATSVLLYEASRQRSEAAQGARKLRGAKR
jgi:TrmH family RNA methyltransferase